MGKTSWIMEKIIVEKNQKIKNTRGKNGEKPHGKNNCAKKLENKKYSGEKW